MATNKLFLSNENFDLSLDSLMNNLPSAVGIKNQDSIYIAANQKLAEIAGFDTPSNVIGCTDSNLNCRAADLHSVFVKQDQEVLNGVNQTNIDISLYAGDKLSIYLSTKNKITDNEGREFVFLTMTNLPILSISHIFNISGYTSTKDLNVICKSYTTSFSNLLTGDLDLNLTERQSECLFYLLRGRSYKEIAAIMKISNRTVEDYVNIIKQKLGCHSKSQIHEKALELGLNQVLPISLFQNFN